MQNQSSQWLNVRRDRPDWMIMWGWGAMNPTAVKEAAKISFPMDKFVGVWWPGEDDARPAGAGAKGYLDAQLAMGSARTSRRSRTSRNTSSTRARADAEGQGRRDSLQSRRLNSMLIAEGIRNAQKVTGKKVVTGEDVRRGLETINLDAARLKELGLEGFAAPIELSCNDHNGHRAAFMQQWDGTKWVKVSD